MDAVDPTEELDGPAAALGLPDTGLMGMRIGLEFNSVDEFANTLAAALARSGNGGATLVARLDLGDLAIHIPNVDGPAWNVVPLLHLHSGDNPTAEEWAAASAVLERMERYR